ncbi:MAG: hypothetical protein QXU32_09235 [Nitrososphaerales archaeon]
MELEPSDIERYIQELRGNLEQVNRFEPILNILSRLGDGRIFMKLTDESGNELANITCQVKNGKVVGLESNVAGETDIQLTIDVRALHHILEKPTKDRFLREYLRKRIKVKDVSLGQLLG